MSDGSGSTLVLQPNGLSEITFDLAVSTAIGSGGYTVDLGSLRLGEEKREVVSYAESVGAEGGEKTGVTNPLVPVSFSVVVIGTTRADCMEKAHELRMALQAGGYLKYKPEDLPAGVTASFYRYLPSGPGALQARSGNRWDAVAKGGSFKLVLDVSMMTYPLLMSDPDSPVTVVSSTTVYNHDDGGTGHNNWVTVPAASLKGDSRALLQIMIRNLETGDYDDITGVYVFPRIYGLDNYHITFEPGSVVVGSTEWATITDAAKSGGSYQRLTPSAADVAYRLQYAVSNWADMIGRHLLMIACRDNGGAEGDFVVRAGWSLGSGEVLDPTPWVSSRAVLLGEWQLFSLGEIEFPGTQTADVESGTAPYYELEVKRISGGSGTLEVDFFVAGPVDLRPLYVDCSGVSFLNAHELLLSNLQYPIQVAHIVNQSSHALVGPVKPLGLLPLANPGKEATDGYRLYFLWERREGSLVVDDSFDGYDSNWEMIDDCDSGWTNGAEDSNKTEGDYSQSWSSGGGNPYKGVSKDFSGWADTDYFVMIAYRDYGENDYYVRFYDGSDYFFSSALTMAEYWQVLKCAKGDFSTSGSPSWSSIDQLYFSLAGGAGEMDNWRWSKKDPDASQPNDFGSSWDYFLSSCPWFVCTDAASRCAGNGVPVGSYSVPGSAEQLLLSSMSDAQNIKMKGRVYAFSSAHYTGARVGFVARCSDGTSGSEDCYALVLDTDNDTLSLYKYVAGTPALIAATGFSASADTWHWVGIEIYESSITCYAHASEGSLWDVPLIEATDTAHTTGKCGLIVTDGMGRFDNVEVWAESDRYTPGDTCSVEVKALLRGVYPHYE